MAAKKKAARPSNRTAGEAGYYLRKGNKVERSLSGVVERMRENKPARKKAARKKITRKATGRRKSTRK